MPFLARIGLGVLAAALSTTGHVMTIESIPVLMSTKHEFHNCAADELRSNDSGSATLEASTAILLSGSIGTVVAIGSQTSR